MLRQSCKTHVYNKGGSADLKLIFQLSLLYPCKFFCSCLSFWDHLFFYSSSSFLREHHHPSYLSASYQNWSMFSEKRNVKCDFRSKPERHSNQEACRFYSNSDWLMNQDLMGNMYRNHLNQIFKRQTSISINSVKYKN